MITKQSRLHLAFLILGASIFIMRCEKREQAQVPSAQPAVPRARLVLAEGMQPIAAPVYVAKEMNIWKDLGLDVELVPFTSGRLCLDAVLGGKADAGTMAETPIVHAAFRDAPIYVVAGIHRSEKNTKVVARKDQGIARPADLKGHKVAVSVGTNGEYFMDQFLQRAGLSRKDVEVVNLRPEEMVAAINQGNVSACFTWEPHVQNAKTTLGDKAIIFANDGVYTETYNIVISRSSAESKPAEIKLLLQGLSKAAAYIHDKPDESVRIVSKHVGLDASLLKSIWSDYTFRVSLDQSLVDLLNEEAKWAKQSGIAAPDATLPDFHRYILTDPLKAVDPAAVSIK
jgi:ABC-type nitrate/sulfonate/bicarbonate transport system substrate-binding protein